MSDASTAYADALDDWERVFVYYAGDPRRCRRACDRDPWHRSAARHLPADRCLRSRLARAGSIGQLLFAVGAEELYPSVAGGPVATRPDDLVQWWMASTAPWSYLMTVHLTSSVRMGENRARTGADSFGTVGVTGTCGSTTCRWCRRLPGVNPQAAVMTIAVRNAEHFPATP